MQETPAPGHVRPIIKSAEWVCYGATRVHRWVYEKHCFVCSAMRNATVIVPRIFGNLESLTRGRKDCTSGMNANYCAPCSSIVELLVRRRCLCLTARLYRDPLDPKVSIEALLQSFGMDHRICHSAVKEASLVSRRPSRIALPCASYALRVPRAALVLSRKRGQVGADYCHLGTAHSNHTGAVTRHHVRHSLLANISSHAVSRVWWSPLHGQLSVKYLFLKPKGPFHPEEPELISMSQ